MDRLTEVACGDGASANGDFPGEADGAAEESCIELGANGTQPTPAVPTLLVAPLPTAKTAAADADAKAGRGGGGGWIRTVTTWTSTRATAWRTWLDRHRVARRRLSAALVHCVVAAYVVLALLHWQREVKAGRAVGLEFCEGVGFLLIVLGVIYFAIFYYAALKPYGGPWLHRLSLKASPCASLPAFRWTTTVLALAVLIGLLLLDIGSDVRRLVSLLGVVVFVLLGFVFSRHPRQVRWRPVLTGLFLQFLMGLLTIRFPGGRVALECFAQKVAALLRCANEGSTFVFGHFLVVEKSVFAFQVLPVVFFFSSLIQVLYYLGAMQWVVSRLGAVLQAIMGTTVCESVTAAASVFLGMTECPLLIKPYIESLTSSEMHAVMGTGFATASGSVLAAYISFGADPGHLLTASVMSATGALAYSKLLLPETEESKTNVEHLAELSEVKSEDSSIIDAASRGASAAIHIVLNITANLVAFVSLLYLLNSVAAWLGSLVGLEDFSFETVLGKLFVPVVWLMGVEPADCEKVATLVGLKTVVNEFVAFQRMSELKAANMLSPRSLAVTTLVLCGFANLASLAILISVLAAMAPSARNRVSDVALRSLVAGIVTCCITASMGGMLMTDESFPAVVSATGRLQGAYNHTAAVA